jgi:hypothetical protein
MFEGISRGRRSWCKRRLRAGFQSGLKARRGGRTVNSMNYLGLAVHKKTIS